MELEKGTICVRPMISGSELPETYQGRATSVMSYGWLDKTNEASLHNSFLVWRRLNSKENTKKAKKRQDRERERERRAH